jgi:hypothetical protein
VRTRIQLPHHTELEDLETHIALTHEGGDGLKRKKRKNWIVDFDVTWWVIGAAEKYSVHVVGDVTLIDGNALLERGTTRGSGY